MQDSYPFDPSLHEAGSTAAQGRCSFHSGGDASPDSCLGEAVVSYRDADDRWQSGCALALEELVERGEIAPLGQGA
jgi:hypothetical protein